MIDIDLDDHDFATNQEMVQHVCSLKNVQRINNIVEARTKPGCFYYLRKWFRHFTMASAKDPLSQVYLKSITDVNVDRKNHYVDHFWTIHPCSKAAVAIQIHYILCYTLATVLYPMSVTTGSYCVYVIKLVLDCMFWLHIVVSFFLGYIDDEKTIVLDNKKIFKRYFFRYFLIEAISSIHFKIWNYFRKPERIFYSFLSCLKIFRYSHFYACTIYISMRFNISRRKTILYRIVLVTISFVTWNAALLLVIATFHSNIVEWEVTENARFHQFCRAFFEVTTLMVSSDRTIAETNSDWDIILALNIYFSILAALKYYIIFALFWRMTMYYKGGQAVYRSMLRELDKYCEQKQLPNHLKKRLKNYLTFRFDQSFYKEKLINIVLTPHLKREIAEHVGLIYLKEVRLFRILPTNILVLLAQKVIMGVYVEKEILLEKRKDIVFIIARGTCAAYSTEGKEICHMVDQNYFGELNLILNTEFLSAQVVSLTSCQLYYLLRTDFDEIMSEYPVYLERVKKSAKKMMQKNQMYMMELGVNVILPQCYIEKIESPVSFPKAQPNMDIDEG